MARKKNTVAPASPSRRPPTATDLSNLRDVNSRLISKVVELRKQVQLRIMLASNDSARCIVKCIEVNGVALSSLLHSTAAVTPATPAASELKSGAETAAGQKQSKHHATMERVGGVLSSTFDSTAAGCVNCLPPVKLDLAAEHEADAETTMTEQETTAKQSKQSVSMLPSVSADHGNIVLMEMEEKFKWTEEMMAQTSTSSMSAAAVGEEINEIASGKHLSEKNEPAENPAASKKMRNWGFSGGWIFSGGILVAIALAIFAASRP